MANFSMSDIFWHGTPCEVFWMLYMHTDVITVINVQDFDLLDYHSNKFVRNGVKKPHAFDEKEEAIDFLNQRYEKEQIDPEYWQGGDSFLIRD